MQRFVAAAKKTRAARILNLLDAIGWLLTILALWLVSEHLPFNCAYFGIHAGFHGLNESLDLRQTLVEFSNVISRGTTVGKSAPCSLAILRAGGYETVISMRKGTHAHVGHFRMQAA